MSSIKLKHSGGNAVSLHPPTSAPTSSDVQFKLPTADGSANQVLKTDGSGNLSFGADSGGLNASYARITDSKGSGTQGGSFTSGDWRTRELNREISDPDGIVSISSDQFTLGAGTYFLDAQAPAYRVDAHQLAIYDATAGAYLNYGSITQSRSTDQTVTTAFVSFIHTITANNLYEIRHRGATTKSSNGFGVSVSWAVGHFCVGKIFKLK